MTTRIMLLPAPPDPVTCDGCGWHMAWTNLSGKVCHGCDCFTVDDMACYPGRLPECLAAEKAAASQSAELERLRRVEAIARELVDADKLSVESERAKRDCWFLWLKLRAALEEK